MAEYEIVKRLRGAELWSRHTRDGVMADGTPYDAADAIESLAAALLEVQDKLWVLRCNSRNEQDRAAADKAVEMATAALAKLKGETK